MLKYVSSASTNDDAHDGRRRTVSVGQLLCNTRTKCHASSGPVVNQSATAVGELRSAHILHVSSNATSSAYFSCVNLASFQVIPMCVYLMSRVAVHMEIEGTAQCMLIDSPIPARDYATVHQLFAISGPAQVILAATVGCDELGISNKLLAQNIFALWMTSPLLELQLKCQHRPFGMRVAWAKLINRYSTANALQKRYDEPMIQLRRSVFIAKREEEKVK